jgi:calcineurin-like phosphoesterase family protein
MSNRKSIYFTSDLHFGHANSIKFDNRPFRDLDHMHRVLINNYNSVVPESGVCYILGDFGMMGSGDMKKIVNQLNGTKVLISGNHDKGHNSMYNVGFDVVLNSAELYISGERVTMSHCPLRGVFREDVSGMKGGIDGENWHGETRHYEYSLESRGQFHLHGHIHSPNGGKSTKILGRQYDVGVPANNYRPVSISDIEAFIAKVKKNEK